MRIACCCMTVFARLFFVFHLGRQRVVAWLFLRVPLAKATCSCVTLLRMPLVKVTCCCVAVVRIPLVKASVVIAYATGEATCCCITVFVWYWYGQHIVACTSDTSSLLLWHTIMEGITCCEILFMKNKLEF